MNQEYTTSHQTTIPPTNQPVNNRGETTAAPKTALRREFKSRSAIIFLDLEKSFELISKEVMLELHALLGIRGQLLMWLGDYLSNRTGTVQFPEKKS